MSSTLPDVQPPPTAPDALPPPTAGPAVGPAVGDSGLVLGRDRSGATVRLNLFRERVTSVTALLAPDLVAVLAVRCLATGAHLCVVTAEPEPWTRVRALGGVTQDDLTLLAPLAHPAEEASFVRPLIVVRLGDQLPGVVRLRPGPWRAAMTVVPRFTPHAVAMAGSSQLVVVGQQTTAEAESTARSLNLADATAALLTGLSDGEVVLIAGDRVVVVDLEPSPFELAVRQAMSVRP